MLAGVSIMVCLVSCLHAALGGFRALVVEVEGVCLGGWVSLPVLMGAALVRVWL